MNCPRRTKLGQRISGGFTRSGGKKQHGHEGHWPENITKRAGSENPLCRITNNARNQRANDRIDHNEGDTQPADFFKGKQEVPRSLFIATPGSYRNKIWFLRGCDGGEPRPRWHPSQFLGFCKTHSTNLTDQCRKCHMTWRFGNIAPNGIQYFSAQPTWLPGPGGGMADALA